MDIKKVGKRIELIQIRLSSLNNQHVFFLSYAGCIFYLLFSALIQSFITKSTSQLRELVPLSA